MKRYRNMHKQYKSDPIDLRVNDNGSISGYFSTFDHDHGDSYGDVVRRGAFLNTIERRKKTGHPFPLLYGHDFNQIIGRVTDIGEDSKGAYFSADFFPTERAQEIREIVKAKVLWQFSFAYAVLDQGKVRAGDGKMVNELRELDLYEISIVGIPANDRATITDIKRDKPKNVRSAEAERILAYIKQIQKEEQERLEKARAEALYTIDQYRAEERREQYEKMKADPVKHLAHLRKLEAKALEDIKRLTRANDRKGANGRKAALRSIREQIRQEENRLK